MLYTLESVKPQPFDFINYFNTLSTIQYYCQIHSAGTHKGKFSRAGKRKQNSVYLGWWDMAQLHGAALVLLAHTQYAGLENLRGFEDQNLQ